MDDLETLLNWRLLRGSHEFPGPDGGTCVNEAAIVAAGFAYRKVGHARELPACFCPVIGAVSIWLNDAIHDPALRMRLLLPFVLRLAGTRGGPGDERRRLDVLRARLLAAAPERLRRRRFSFTHQDPLMLGPWVGALVRRRFTIAGARDVRELLCAAERVRAALPVDRLAPFYEALARGLSAMLEVGPRTTTLEADLVRARLDRARLGAAV